MSAVEEFTQTAVSSVVNANSVARHFIQRNLDLREALRQIELGALHLQDPMYPASVQGFGRDIQLIATEALVKDASNGR